jgi:4-hydroxybenzoate polyprenyltransferase
MITARQLWWAAAVAALACVPLSLLAGGLLGGGCHLLAVASAWSYDLVLKTTSLSFLPYVVSFGLVPPFLTYGLDPPRPPAWWGVVAFALLGLGAHLANGVPDVEGDRAVGAGGLVARLGPDPARWLATATLLGATVLLVSRILGTGWALAVLAAVLAWTVLAAVRDRGRAMFDAVLVLAVLDAGLLCLDASALVGG